MRTLAKRFGLVRSYNIVDVEDGNLSYKPHFSTVDWYKDKQLRKAAIKRLSEHLYCDEYTIKLSKIKR